jgi:PadR family transcriptional regulator PadR
LNAADALAATRKFEKELKSGTVAIVLLGILKRSGRPMYGYQITKHLEEGRSMAAGTAPSFKQGALYPVLRSMEKHGILESEIEPSTSGPPRRYYSITDAGGDILHGWTAVWEGTRDLVDSILKGNDDV